MRLQGRLQGNPAWGRTGEAGYLGDLTALPAPSDVLVV